VGKFVADECVKLIGEEGGYVSTWPLNGYEY
jgi:hypothetical protein